MKSISVLNPFRTVWLQRLLVLILALAGLCSILATGGGGGGDGTVVSTASVGSSSGSSVTPGAMSISASQTSVKSDNSDSSTITVLVLDTNNVPANGISVGFASTGGQISAASSTTDTSGKASITFSAGVSTNGNQTVTITATVSGLAAVQVPVDITGSTVTLASNNNSLTVGAVATATLTITVKDSSGSGVLNAAVTIAIDAASTGAGTLSAASGTTDVNGQLPVTVTGTGAGNLLVNVTSQGSTATETYTVGTAGSVFAITAPAADPATLTSDGVTTLTVTLSVPDAFLPANIVFATSLGTWGNGNSTVTVANNPVGNNTLSQLLKSATAGTATVQVYIQPTAAPFTITTVDTLKVAMSAPASAAASINLQTDVGVVQPSIGTTTHTANLTARVLTNTAQPVGDVAVVFSLSNTTGGGEYISPVVAYTNATGFAYATFTSGTLASSGSGVRVTATELTNNNTDTADIIIGNSTASVIVGTGNPTNASSSTYATPMTVFAVDPNGNPMSGQTVTLGVWPTEYIPSAVAFQWVNTGVDTEGNPINCRPQNGAVVVGAADFKPNEDADRNFIISAGDVDLNNNGILDPPSAASGAVPVSVTTDSNGMATFNLTYPMSSAGWVKYEVRSTVVVLGVNNTTITSGTLNASEGDRDGCSNGAAVGAAPQYP